MQNKDLSSLTIDKQASGLSPKHGRRKLFFIVAALLIIAGGFFLWRMLVPSVSVETGLVTKIYPSQTFTVLNASGYVVAQRKAALAPKTTGQLEWLGVEEGSRVHAGQIVARLENRDVSANRNQASANVAVARANVEQAKAELTDAKRAFERVKELLSGGIVAQAEYDTAETRLNRARAALSGMDSSVRSAEASLSGANTAVDYTMIRAPFDGVVLTKNADIGDIITPIGAAANAKAAVITIADLASVQVEADVSESNLSRIKVGQPCEIQLDALPDLRFRGILHTIVPTADRSKASIMVKVRFLDRNINILPEMSAKVAFLEREVKNEEQQPKTAVLPSAIIERNGKKVVFVVKDKVVKETVISTGAAIGDMIEVISGVKAGETVVLKQVDRLRDGMKVKQAEKR